MTDTLAAPAVTTRSRLGAALRLGVVGTPMRLGLPWAIVGVALALSLVIAGLVTRDDSSSGQGIGALAAFYAATFGAYLQAMTQTFGFALSLGITRRHYYASVLALVTAESLASGVGLTVLSVVERATGGWGLGLRFFAVSWFAAPDPVIQVLVFAAPLAALSLLGIVGGAVFKRAGQVGLWAAVVGIALAVAVVVLLITALGWGPAAGAVVSGLSHLTAVVVVPAILAVVLAGAGFLLVRRAAP